MGILVIAVFGLANSMLLAPALGISSFDAMWPYLLGATGLAVYMKVDN